MDNFESYISGLSKKTVDNHKRYLDKIIDMIGDIDVSQDYFISNLDTDNNSEKLQMLKTFSVYLKVNNRPNDKILKVMSEVNESLKEGYKTRNKETTYNVTLKMIKDKMNEYYENKLWKNYIITYLVLKYNTRNKDLDIIIVRNKKDLKTLPTDKNHLIIYKNSVKYIRHNYKTVDQYGDKIHLIKTKKFVESVNNYLGEDNHKLLFTNWSNSTRDIKKIIPYGLKTSDLTKITLLENNDLKSVNKISKNRGTSMKTLHSNYNIKI